MLVVRATSDRMGDAVEVLEHLQVLLGEVFARVVHD
jgi:hypothetical protein